LFISTLFPIHVNAGPPFLAARPQLALKISIHNSLEKYFFIPARPVRRALIGVRYSIFILYVHSLFRQDPRPPVIGA
jgi:hypothetical protein